MNRPPISSVRGRAAFLPEASIDTDQIIPARFLTATSRAGLGSALFADRRTGCGGRSERADLDRREFPLDRPAARGAQILVAGADFGCGSSREHAVWALVEAGFRAVVAPSFSDIFRGNAIENRLVPAAIDEGVWRAWVERAALAPNAAVELEIDVAALAVHWPEAGESTPFALDPFARHCLLLGVDAMGYLLRLAPEIAAFERTRAGAPDAIAIAVDDPRLGDGKGGLTSAREYLREVAR